MRIVLFVVMLVISGNVYTQSVINQRVTIRPENKTLVEILYQLSQDNDVRFYFDPDGIPYYNFNKTYENKQLWDVLQDLLNGTNIKPLPYKDNIIVLLSKNEISKSKMDEVAHKWEDGTYNYPFDTKNKKLSYSFGPTTTNNADNVELNIKLYDDADGEPIIGAVVRNQDMSINGVTDFDGMLTLELPSGDHLLTMTYTGYQGIDLDLSIHEDAEVEIPMEVQRFLLDEVEIVANNAQQKLENTKAGAEVLNISKLEVIPQVLGETDIIKSLELLPGVTSVGEISSGFNVRGGNIDESLVLLNDGIIFNPTHVIGFISAFNADVIRNATLYKGYVDAEFGNRSSAVLHLESGAPKREKIRGKGGLGTSVIRLMLEGPISNKLDFQVSARGSFSDYLLDNVRNLEVQNSSAQFYDVNASLDYQINDFHHLSIHSYYSDDFFEYNQEFGFEWQNKHLGLQWRSSWSDDFYTKLSMNYGGYKSNQFTINTAESADFTTDLSYLKGLFHATRSLGEKGFIKAGVEYIDYNLAPDFLVPRENSSLSERSIQRRASFTISPFIAANRKLTDELDIEVSLRHSNYVSQGPGNIYEYGENIERLSITDTLQIDGVDNDGIYAILEPRISINYKVNNHWSVKAGYNKLSQNAQLISISNTALPTDYWIFSNRHIRPQQVRQFSTGVFHNDPENRFNFSVEGFYKFFDHAQVLRNFPRIILNDHIETELTEATGRSYGLELFFEKTKGKVTGSLAYTYSKTTRKTNGNININNGEVFPADFDIPHQFNAVMVYQIIPTFSFNMAYVYKSGRPITVPEAIINQDNFSIPIYTVRNQERIPSYQRLDLSITLDMRESKRSGFRSSFTFGIYNFLGRDNAFNVFFRRNELGRVVPFKFSLIASPVPSLSWNFVF